MRQLIIGEAVWAARQMALAAFLALTLLHMKGYA